MAAGVTARAGGDRQVPWVSVVVAMIGLIGSVATATITASCQARTEASAAGQSAAKEQIAATLPVPVGTVIGSMLNYEQLKAVVGENWVPADGRLVSTDSIYARRTGRTQVPDLRGRFIRGLNLFDPATGSTSDGDTDSQRQVGSAQPDGFKSHHHSNGTGSTDVINRQMTKSSSRIPSYIKDEFNGDTVLSTNDVGDLETRPRNVALFYYMKIN